MIDFKIKYQAVIFINAKEIIPDAKNISNLVTKFSDYNLVPNTIQELSNEGQRARLSLKSQDGEWEVRFGSKKVDIEKKPTDTKGTNLGSLSDFTAEVKDITDIVFEVVGKKASRLSLLSRYILGEMSEDRLNEVYATVFNPTDFYSRNFPVEWNSRMASRFDREFDGLTETFNFIYELNRIQGNIQRKGTVNKIDRLELKTDINTYQNNTDPRFVSDNANAFFNNASEWENDLKTEILDFINNE